MREKLLKFSDEKLTDIVKNYKQYGYSIELRNETLEILNERGINSKMLDLQGNLNNETFKDSEELYNAFSKYSKIAFVTYLVLLILKISENILPVLSLLSLVIGITFLVYIIKSFLVQEKFYKVTGAQRSQFDAIIYFMIGMPLYIGMHFYYKNLMTVELNKIR
ncbi:hypothetical protein ACXGQW_00785 [Wenyingzhuangia sp. IMCC45533]